MRHPRFAAASALLLSALAAHAGAVGRLGNTGSFCKEDTPTRRLDVSGKADACAKEAPPSCDGGLVIQADAKGTADACVRPAPGGAAAEKTERPRCPSGLRLAPRTGADICERTAGPACGKGYHLEARTGEDRCVR